MASSITGVLGQIATVASYAIDILQELKDETTAVTDRMSKLHQRVDVLAEVVESQIRRHDARKSEANLLHLLPSQEESDRVLCVQTISNSTPSATNSRPATVLEAYEHCERVPPLEPLDSFYDSEQRDGSENHLDNHHAASISRKKYSNPGFFMEEWLKNEEGRQQRALEMKEGRRRERRDVRNLHKTYELDQQRQTTGTDDTKRSGSTDDTEQKLKFMKIRSWREIYGTGEGKELMKQPNGRSPSLRDLRRKAHQSLVSITQSPPRSEGRQRPASPPPPPPPPQDELTHQSPTNEQVAMTTPPIPTSLGGAFMQEMDDAEITMEMKLEEEFTNGIPPPPPPLPDSTSPDEFTDHGLSYYYDPTAMHNLTPPLPPPPELDEQSKSDAFYDTYENDNDTVPSTPSPPLMEEFEQPPPPPSPPPSSELPRASSLLEEIRLGASLRSVTDRQRQRDAPVRPQAALLQQILQKQSRSLRPVEPRARPPLQTRSSTGAPFADSIARILERRAVIAYDSDSDSHKSNSSNNDNDW